MIDSKLNVVLLGCVEKTFSDGKKMLEFRMALEGQAFSLYCSKPTPADYALVGAALMEGVLTFSHKVRDNYLKPTFISFSPNKK